MHIHALYTLLNFTMLYTFSTTSKRVESRQTPAKRTPMRTRRKTKTITPVVEAVDIELIDVKPQVTF